MDTIFMSSSAEKSFSPYKQLKNIPKRNTGVNFVSKLSENLAPTNIIHGGGLLFAPPSSYLPSASLLNPVFYQNDHQLQRQQQRQPPLLPLPTSHKPLHSSLPSRTRSLSSSSPSNRKNNKTRDQSLTPKRSKSKQLIITAGKIEDQPKKYHLKATEATKTQAISKSFVMASANPLGPDPNDLPMALASSYIATGNVAKDLNKFSGSVFTLSPPPSSLPLPKFSLRTKV